MLEAITYQKMLQDIQKRKINNTIGILLTRPDLKVGKNILYSLNYYHHMTGKNLNFYLPGYGAYWYGAYPDGQVVSKISGTEWSYSDKLFVEFINDLEKHSTWIYSGESELLMLKCEQGNLYFSQMIRFYLDDMIRENAIPSISVFFQQLARVCKDNDTIDTISNILGRTNLAGITAETILSHSPSWLEMIFKQGKHFCIKNYSVNQ